MVAVFAIGGNSQPKQEVDNSNYVLVATVDLTSGSFIKTSDHLRWVEIREGSYPEEQEKKFIRKAGTDILKFEGAVVRSLMVANKPVDRNKIVTPGDGGFMSAVLNPGMRAMSIGVNVVSGNAGFIFPGDKVDVLLTHNVQGGEGQSSYVTETIVEDVRVLAIDQQVNNPERKAFVAKTVTLEVFPKQAEEVLVASELGKISLILRSMGSAAVSTDINAVATKNYTRDSEVSKVLQDMKPSDTTNVTVTRGGK